MALFRKLFYRKPPDGLLEICERVYVFDCCFTTDTLEEQDYKGYVGGIVTQLREHYPDASILAFNFREGVTQSQMANAMTEYNMTIMEYPRQFEGCPLLPMEVIHHFLRSCESWLSLGLQNLLLMHCERGGWPVLAFMLSALLIYRRHYSGEFKTLEMVYKQAPRELLYLLAPLNPIPSQIRYLQYVSRRNFADKWPPVDRALTMDCIIIRMIPNFDGEGGCKPIFRIYGQDPFLVSDRAPKVLFSTPKKSKVVRYYKQTECEIIKVDINCHIQGDVVLECINLHDNIEQEEMMFRVMFNTAFIRSNILMLNRDEIDILWDGKDLFPKDFRAEVLFSEMDTAASIIPLDCSCFEEKDGLPEEAFAKVQEIFNSVDWLVPKGDATVEVLQHLALSNDAYSPTEKSRFNQPLQVKSVAQSPTDLISDNQSNFSPESSPSAYMVSKQAESLTQNRKKSPSVDHPPPPPLQLSIAKTLHFSPNQESVAKDVSPPSEVAITQPKDGDVGPEQHLSSNLIPPLKDDTTIRPRISSPSAENLGSHDKVINDGSPKLEHPASTKDVVQASRVTIPLPPTHASSTVNDGKYGPTSLSSDLNSNEATGDGLPSSHLSSPGTGVNLKNAPTEPYPQNLYESASTCALTSPALLPFRTPPKGSSACVVDPPPPPPPALTPNLTDSSTNRPIPPPAPPPIVGSNVSSSVVGGRPLLPTPLPPPPLISPAPEVVPPLPSTSSLTDSSVARSAPCPPLLTPEPPKEGSSGGGPPLPPPPPHSWQGPPSGSVPSPPSPPPELPKESSRGGGLPLPPPPPPPHSSQSDPSVTRPAPCPPPPPPPPTPPKETSSGSSPPLPPPAPNCNHAGPPPPPPPSVPSMSTGGSRANNLSGPSPPPPLAPPGMKGKILLSRTATSRNNQTKKLKPLHWLKISRAVSGSLWAEAQRSGEASKAPEIDISELESLFSAAVPSSDQGGRKTGSRGSMGQKPEKVQLIEHRRAYNCEIMLSKVKIPLPDMLVGRRNILCATLQKINLHFNNYSSVLALEDSALDVDQVDNLIKFCPTKEEMDLLKGYKGEKDKLGKCEQFFLELMQVPRIEYKLRVFSFKIQFSTQVSDLRNSLNVVNSAADQIKGSAKLKRIMQTILSLGNALNQGTARGSAVGFRLDSLLKLTETRARNNKMTLMHYLCKVLSDKLPELLDFWKDLYSLEPASKIQLKFLAEEMQAINKGLEKVMQELSMAESDGPVSDHFCKALKEFLCFSEGEVRSLASLYAGVGRNVDSLILYFGEDPARCPFEQVISTLLNFVKMFKKSHEENCKQQEFEKKKAEKEAKINPSDAGHLLEPQVK